MNHRIRALVAIALAGSLLGSTAVRGQTLDPSYLREMPPPARILSEIKGKDVQDTIERQMGAFMALNKMIDDMAWGLEHRYLPTGIKPDELRIKDMYGHAYAALWHKAVRKEEHKYDHDWDLFDELMAKFFSQSFQELHRKSSATSQARYKASREKNSGVVFGGPPSDKAKKEEIHQLCKAKGLDDFTCMLQSAVKGAIKALDLKRGEVKPGLNLSGVYVTKNFSVFLTPELTTWVSCGEVFLSTNYTIELKDGQVFVNIKNGNDSFALRMQPDGGSLTGSGTVPLHGYVPGGGSASESSASAPSSTEVTTTRQRELTPLEANQYQNAVKNGQTYTINETTTSTEYTSGTFSTGNTVQTFIPKTASCQVGVLALKPQMAAPGDRLVEGLRMNGTYLGDGGAHIEFSPEKAIVGCGQTLVERSYDVNVRNGGQVFINIPGNGGAESFSLRPDGILSGSGATVTLNGKRKTGEDRLGDDTYVQSSDTCTYGILAPPGKSRRSTPASNTTTSSVAKNTPGPGSTTTSIGPPVLTVTNGFIGQATNPLGGRELLVLKASFEDALRKAGFQDPPGAAVKRSAVAIWAAACKSRTPMCKQGIDALQGFYAGKIRLDQSGTASVSGMPQGSFWILGLGTANGQHFVWNLPIEIKPGSNSIAFDTRNTTLIY